MFGKPQWFRHKTSGYGLAPVSWQGWLYTVAWMLAIAAPFSLLILRNQPIEAVLWMMAALGALAYDVRQVGRTIPRPSSPSTGAPAAGRRPESVLFIGDGPSDMPVQTRQFKLFPIRRS